jgi:hypothetical protein
VASDHRGHFHYPPTGITTITHTTVNAKSIGATRWNIQSTQPGHPNGTDWPPKQIAPDQRTRYRHREDATYGVGTAQEEASKDAGRHSIRRRWRREGPRRSALFHAGNTKRRGWRPPRGFLFFFPLFSLFSVLIFFVFIKGFYFFPDIKRILPLYLNF